LLQDTSYCNELHQRYFELIENEILTVDHLHRMVQILSNEVRTHVEKNEARWGHNAIYSDHVDFIQEVNLIQAWIPRHLELLHAYFSTL
jgi:hypothetical protein